MTHTWNLYLTYHRCPDCSYIFESRQDYRYSKKEKKYLKELLCPRCQHSYILEQERPSSFAPLFGKPPKPEFNWD